MPWFEQSLRSKPHKSALYGVFKHQNTGVKQQTVRLDEYIGVGIEGITQNGVAYGLAVNAQLVGAPSQGFEQHMGLLALCVDVQHPQARLAGFAVGVVYHLLWAIGPIGTHGQLNGAPSAVRLFHAAAHYGLVLFVDLALGKLGTQGALHRWAARHDDEPRGCHIEPMDDERIRVECLYSGA